VRYHDLRQVRAVRHGGGRGFSANHPNDVGSTRVQWMRKSKIPLSFGPYWTEGDALDALAKKASESVLGPGMPVLIRTVARCRYLTRLPGPIELMRRSANSLWTGVGSRPHSRLVCKQSRKLLSFSHEFASHASHLWKESPAQQVLRSALKACPKRRTKTATVIGGNPVIRFPLRDNHGWGGPTSWER
jgi:hypothetical protein